MFVTACIPRGRPTRPGKVGITLAWRARADRRGVVSSAEFRD
jgi:hypothetical protein